MRYVLPHYSRNIIWKKALATKAHEGGAYTSNNVWIRDFTRVRDNALAKQAYYEAIKRANNEILNPKMSLNPSSVTKTL